MKTKQLVRFPNDSEFVEMNINMDNFQPEKEFEMEIFGWYDGTYISIKKITK